MKIVVRLCAYDEKATELCNKIDNKLNSVVLFDYWGEAVSLSTAECLHMNLQFRLDY